MSVKSTKTLDREHAIELLLARINDRSVPNIVLEAMLDAAYEDGSHNYVVIQSSVAGQSSQVRE